MHLIIDPLVADAIITALDYWASKADHEELIGRLVVGFDVAFSVIERDPRRGRRVSGLPDHYRRMRLASTLPGYFLYYRIEASRVLAFLLRHERQRPYVLATIQRKASEAARRADQSGTP